MAAALRGYILLALLSCAFAESTRPRSFLQAHIRDPLPETSTSAKLNEQHQDLQATRRPCKTPFHEAVRIANSMTSTSTAKSRRTGCLNLHKAFQALATPDCYLFNTSHKRTQTEAEWMDKAEKTFAAAIRQCARDGHEAEDLENTIEGLRAKIDQTDVFVPYTQGNAIPLGATVRVTAEFWDPAGYYNQFTVDFLTNSDDNDIAFHWNPRQNPGGMVHNAGFGKESGSEVRSISFNASSGSLTAYSTNASSDSQTRSIVSRLMVGIPVTVDFKHRASETITQIITTSLTNPHISYRLECGNDDACEFKYPGKGKKCIGGTCPNLEDTSEGMRAQSSLSPG